MLLLICFQDALICTKFARKTGCNNTLTPMHVDIQLQIVYFNSGWFALYKNNHYNNNNKKHNISMYTYIINFVVGAERGDYVPVASEIRNGVAKR